MEWGKFIWSVERNDVISTVQVGHEPPVVVGHSG